MSTGARARPEIVDPSDKKWPHAELSYPIRQARAAQVRMLDSIVHLPLRTMVRQLG